jgi:hypothetical protein
MPLGANKVALFGASADTGTSILLSTGVASSSASLAFTIPATYKQIVFGFYNIAPATDGVNFEFQVNATDSSGYDRTMTTTFFRAFNYQNGSNAGLGYEAAEDQAEGTAFQSLSSALGNGASKSTAGGLHLFNPSSTTYVKQFYSRMDQYHVSTAGVTRDIYVAGYINDTTAIDDIQFKMSSGNIASGTIKMWGVL